VNALASVTRAELDGDQLGIRQRGRAKRDQALARLVDGSPR